MASYNAFLRDIDTSQTLLLNEQSRHLELSGQKIYKFGFGQSPFMPPTSVIEALKTNAHRKEYAPVQGIMELREAVAQFHQTVDGIHVKATEVLIAPGSKSLLYTIMLALSRATIIVPVPSWVSYIPQAHLVGHRVVTISTMREQRRRLTAQQLELAVQSGDQQNPFVLILNSPGNPDGLSYNADELQALAPVIAKYNILVISDEIYGLLNHTGEHVSMARYCPEQTIITSGLSKWCGAGGWRLGVALLPTALSGAFKETMLGIASEIYSCAALPTQLAACEAYQATPEILDYIARQRHVLALVGQYCAQKLQTAGVDVCPPQGGFYLYLDFTHLRLLSITTAQELCTQLLAETGVALLPGDAFGMPGEHLSARLAYVDFDGNNAMDSAKKYALGQGLPAEFLGKHFSKVIEGIERICEWVAKLSP